MSVCLSHLSCAPRFAICRYNIIVEATGSLQGFYIPYLASFPSFHSSFCRLTISDKNWARGLGMTITKQWDKSFTHKGDMNNYL